MTIGRFHSIMKEREEELARKFEEVHEFQVLLDGRLEILEGDRKREFEDDDENQSPEFALRSFQDIRFEAERRSLERRKRKEQREIRAVDAS